MNKSAAGEIGELTVRGGSLTALGHISLPTGAGGAGFVVDSTAESR